MLDSDESRQISMQKSKKFFELIDDSRVSKMIVSSEDLQSKLDKSNKKSVKILKDLCGCINYFLYQRTSCCYKLTL